MQTFLAEGSDVAAGVKQQLEADAGRLSGLRVLLGSFMTIQQAMGLPKSRGCAAAALLNEFVEESMQGGFVAASLRRHRVDGATVGSI